MSSLRKLAAAGLFALALSACTSTGRVEPGAPPPEADHTYYVMGLAPETVRIMLFKVDLDGGTFRQDPLPPASFVGTADDGYVVGATHAGNTLGITLVELVSSKNALLGTVFEPCGGARSIVFTAPAGKVVYLGNVRFTIRAGSLQPTFSNDIDGARAYLKVHYPQLADQLEQGHFELMPAGKICGSPY